MSLSSKNVRLSTWITALRLNTKFESADMALKPLESTVNLGDFFAAATAAS